MNEIIQNEISKILLEEKKIIQEINTLFTNIEKTNSPEEKSLLENQIKELKKSFETKNKFFLEVLERKNLNNKLSTPNIPQINTPISKKIEKIEKKKTTNKIHSKNLNDLEKKTIKRLKSPKEEETKKSSKRKPNKYVELSSRVFGKQAKKISNTEFFKTLEQDLIKSKLSFIPANYIAMIFFTTLLSVVASFLLFAFFLIFHFGATPPFLTLVNEPILLRMIKVSWILILIPTTTFIFLYVYPSLEKTSLEKKINHELPFATIHMSAISGSMINPVNIFEIIVSTKEYPALEKEFKKLLNEIHIYGYDLVTSLKNVSQTTPSQKLAELLNSLATTITSGGNLPNFFEKRSQNLLFEHRIEREKESKAAETFMDIYISVVIASPMILMLLLVMMKISGLGVSMSNKMISLVMVLGVSLINVIFLVFLNIKGDKS